jgi:N-acetylmuramoyl-L-alanine amidase
VRPDSHRTGIVIAGLLASIACGVCSAAWSEPADGARPSTAATCDAANFRLVVDVGHSAKVGGAISARGVSEYEFNLRLATQIVEALQERGFAKTSLLISTDAPRAGLIRRAERANKLPADLFLSIHHDSVPSKFMEKWEFEGQKRSFSDRFPGHSIFISNDNADRAGSLLFGQLIGRELKARGLKYTPHYVEPFMGNRRRLLVDAEAGVYRYDQLIVLRQTRMPAVLLEAGSIIHRDEELALGLPDRRALTTEAVADAVAAFCAQRSRPSATAAAKSRRAQKDASNKKDSSNKKNASNKNASNKKNASKR